MTSFLALAASVAIAMFLPMAPIPNTHPTLVVRGFTGDADAGTLKETVAPIYTPDADGNPAVAVAFIGPANTTVCELIQVATEGGKKVQAVITGGLVNPGQKIYSTVVLNSPQEMEEAGADELKDYEVAIICGNKDNDTIVYSTIYSYPIVSSKLATH